MECRLCTEIPCIPLNATRSKIASGTASVPIAVLGDSWVDSNIIHQTIQNAAQGVHGTYGGSGWGDVRSFNLTGGWTVVDQQPTSYGLDIYHVETTDPAGEISINGIGTSATLHYACCPGGGDIEIRYNGSPWQLISTNGADALKTTALNTGNASAPASFRIRVVTPGAGVKISGIDFNNGAGVWTHELGNGGLNTNHVVSVLNNPVQKAAWQGSLLALCPCMLVVLIGTNDQGAGITPAQYAANMLQIKDCAQEVKPMDVVLWSSGDNGRNPAPPFGMDEYAAELNAADDPDDCSFCVVDGYATTGPFSPGEPWNSTETHLTNSGYEAFTQPVIQKII